MDLNSLQQELEKLISDVTNENYQEQFSAGFKLISAYKKSGGDQQETYDKLMPLFNKYQDMHEQKSALMGDWLDCICGWVGNKDWYIWNKG